MLETRWRSGGQDPRLLRLSIIALKRPHAHLTHSLQTLLRQRFSQITTVKLVWFCSSKRQAAAYPLLAPRRESANPMQARELPFGERLNADDHQTGKQDNFNNRRFQENDSAESDRNHYPLPRLARRISP